MPNSKVTQVADANFAVVVAAFASDRRVSVPGPGKGFGSGSLKINGKIFAMLSSKNQLVVKLPASRVAELIDAGQGIRFDPGHGRLMKEWLAVTAAPLEWVTLAKEARDFVGK